MRHTLFLLSFLSFLCHLLPAQSSGSLNFGNAPAGSLHFDGVNDHIQVNNNLGNFGSSNVSISVWIQTSSVSPGTILGKRRAASNGKFVNFMIDASGRVVIEFDQDGRPYQALSSKTRVNDGRWHHVAAVRKGTSLQIYIDGVPDGESYSNAVAHVQNDVPFVIGARYQEDRLAHFFNGYMDELQIWNRALCREEILNNMTCELVLPQNGLLAYYRFNQGGVGANNSSITILQDVSGSGNNGYLNSFALQGLRSNWVEGNRYGPCANASSAWRNCDGEGSYNPYRSPSYNPDNFIKNGDANGGNGCFTLTPERNSAKGSVWYGNSLSLWENFDFNFKVYLGRNDNPGADGIAFVLQAKGTGEGGMGQGLGYIGISPSIAVEFDTYQNPEALDPDFDHISIQRNGNISHAASLAGPVRASAYQNNIEDGNWHTVRINWNAATKSLIVYFDGAERARLNENLVFTTFNGNPNVFWGFTGATGGESNLQQFCVESALFTEVENKGQFSANTNSKEEGNWIWHAGEKLTKQLSRVDENTGKNTPGSRTDAAGWSDRNGKLWLFGGFGLDRNQEEGYLNDLWQLDTESRQWKLVKGNVQINQPAVYGIKRASSADNLPAAREDAVTWTDKQGKLWMFGGYGWLNGQRGYFNDLWNYDPVSNQWTWMHGEQGLNKDGIYGEQGKSNEVNQPGARWGALGWSDAKGGFYLFGGWGIAGNKEGDLNDLWQYNPQTNQWVWIKGDNTINNPGKSGFLSIGGKNNKPGAREDAISWIDQKGRLWLFGGMGIIAGRRKLLNDLWRYNPENGNWNNVHAGNLTGTPVSTNPRELDMGNVPGARYRAKSWVDNQGVLWLFGGHGKSTSGEGLLNDLWCFDTRAEKWALVSREVNIQQKGDYGILGQSSDFSKPGSRDRLTSWTDHRGKWWIFGGMGVDELSAVGRLNDLWQYDSRDVILKMAAPKAPVTAQNPPSSNPGNSSSETGKPASGQEPTGVSSTAIAGKLTGEQVDCDCPPGYVVVGYTGRTGAHMDQFSLACQLMNSNGSRAGEIEYTSSNGFSEGGRDFGPFMVQDGSLLTGLQVSFFDDSKTIISGIQGLTQPVSWLKSKIPGVQYAVAALGPRNSKFVELRVPPGHVVTGMSVSSGRTPSSVQLRYMPVSNWGLK